MLDDCSYFGSNCKYCGQPTICGDGLNTDWNGNHIDCAGLAAEGEKRIYTFEQAKDGLIDTIYTVMSKRQESYIKVNGTKYRIFVTQDDYCLVWVKGGAFDCKIEDLPLSIFTVMAKELTRV